VDCHGHGGHGTSRSTIFFLPPLGTLTIRRRANWIALLRFRVARAFASNLSAAVQARAREAYRSPQRSDADCSI
jgi:K+-sensing histidine kinase KdpD